MSVIEVQVPRLNANEDELIVADVLVAEGAMVREGQLLFVVESTKASNEVLSPSDGRVTGVAVEKGKMVAVGSALCRLATEGTGAENSGGTAGDRDGGAAAPGEARITAKARLVARDLGIDIAQVPARAGKIGVKEVEAYAASRASAATGGAAAVAAKTLVSVVPGVSGMPAVMVGGGLHAAIIADAIRGSGYELVGCTDLSIPVGTRVISGVDVVGTDDMLPELMAKGVRTAFIGVGGAVENGPRRKVFERLVQLGFFLPPVANRLAHIGVDATLGPATYVMPGAVVGPRARVGSNVVINTGAIVCHDCVIGDHAHITPGAVLAGSVQIGASTTIGMAASVLYATRIGANCLVHNNAAVTGDLSDNIEFTREGKRTPRK